MKDKITKIIPAVLSEETIPALNLNFNTVVTFILKMGNQVSARTSLSPEGFIKAYNASKGKITLLCGDKTYFSIKKKYVVCYCVEPVREKPSQQPQQEQ